MRHAESHRKKLWTISVVSFDGVKSRVFFQTTSARIDVLRTSFLLVSNTGVLSDR